MNKHSDNFKYKDEDKIRELRAQGFGYSDIARELGRNRKNICKTCRKLGLEMTSDEKARTKRRGAFKPRINWQERLDSNYGSGVVRFLRDERLSTGESQLEIECVKCGCKTTISSISTRTKTQRQYICLGCIQLRKEQERLDKEYEKQEEKRLKEVRKPRLQVAFQFCECGQILQQGYRKCEACRRERDREAWRINDIKRRANTKRVERDKDITLGKLFERDKGVCYLCGNKCDWNDGAWINGAFIVGRNYPTIDHVVALANGGSHTWENIRLAHLSCNSKKGKRDAKLTAPMPFF